MTQEYRRCDTCEEFGWFGGKFAGHICKPKWEWRCNSSHGPDEWEIVRGRDAQEAAERAAESYDADDYSLLRGNEALIFVRDLRDQTMTQWNCSGETIPQYHASEIVP